MDVARAYEGLTQARQRVFDWLRPLSEAQYTQPFPFGLGTLQATMLEIAAVEWLYSRRLTGEPPLPRDQWPISAEQQPLFADLERAWTAQSVRTREILHRTRDWNEDVRWAPAVSPPGKTVTFSATKADVAIQLLFHEVHHRAQVMAMLRQLGVEAQNLDYSRFMFDRHEEPA